MKHLAAAILLVCGIAQAQTTLGETFLYRGVATGKPLSAHPNLAACAASAPVGAFSCEVRGKRVAEPVPPTPCAPAPAASSVLAACVAPTVGSWTQTTTYTRSLAPACTLTTTTSPLAPPAGACTTPQPPTGTALYFSQAGNNANPGTEASPKRDLSGVNVSTLAAGTSLLFKRGDTWPQFNLELKNLNATLAAPLVFDAYGMGERPWLQTPVGLAFLFARNNDAAVDGGYVIRNFKIDGMGTGEWGLWVQGGTRGVVIEGNEITGFKLGIHAQNGTLNNNGLTIRNNHVHHNSDMGMLGDAIDLMFEGNLIADNNFSGSGFSHGLYLGGHGNGVVRGNIFRNNSAPNGVCVGGNFTLHGRWDGLLVENNRVEQQGYGPGCWGISINDGYTSAEFFRNVIVRGNDVRNVQCGACIRAAPGIVIENNTFDADSAIIITPPNGPEDDPGVGATVRNNRVCRGSVQLSVAGATQTGTVTGACP